MTGHVEKRGKHLSIVIEGYRNPQTGKRERKRIAFRGSEKHAEQEMRRIMTKMEEGTWVEPQRLTLADHLEKWLEMRTASKKVEPSTIHTYRIVMNARILPALGKVPLQKLTPQMLQEFYNALIARGLSSSAVHQTHAVMRLAIKLALKWRIISTNPLDGVEMPKITQREVQAPEPDEVAAMLDAIRKEKHGRCFALALYSGMRRGELCGLKWEDVDLKQGVISVRRQIRLGLDGYEEAKPKSSAGLRQVVISGEMLTMLRELRLQNQSVWVFADRKGNFIKPMTLTHAFSRFAKTISRNLRLHDLRHIHATLMLALGVQARIVQGRMGHSTPTMTNRYQHVLRSMQEQAANALDTALQSGHQNGINRRYGKQEKAQKPHNKAIPSDT